MKYVFQNTNVILSQRQPKNMLRILSTAKFRNEDHPTSYENGLYKCLDKRCKICSLYINQCKSFEMSNGKTWEIRSNITCRDNNIVYYLKCNMCNKQTTYIGKTIGDITHGFKPRMNQHISDCRHDKSTCKFPRHVYDCGIKNNCLKEPFFEINVMLKLNNSHRVEMFEKMFHLKGYDTLNCPI